MSKNFELMQQASPHRGSEPLSEMRVSSVVQKGNGHHNGTGLNLEQMARDESLKLVQRIFLLQAGEAPRIVVFAGIENGNGCSRICARAAEILARNVPGSVCLVDANLRSPSLPELFGVTNHRGLTDALLQEGPIRSFMQQLRPENLWLFSCGSLAANSPNLLKTDRLKARLTELHREFDYVLIDAPALNQYTDALTLAQLTDGLVLVLEANSTRRESALMVTQTLRASNIRVLGAVLNKRTFPIPESLYHKL
jgi:capsular exopolysaccharide synthesis family protein